MAEVLGVDVGGTFTDFFATGPDGIRIWKRLSSPHAPQRSVIDGAGDAAAYERLVHGSTVATNAILERRGPRTGLIVTAGYRDILLIRRQERPDMYALEPRRQPHLVDDECIIEVAERLDATGDVVLPLDEAEVERVVAAAKASTAETFALCLLFSFRNASHEATLIAALRKVGIAVTASHEILPEYREYERASTTVANAFLRSTMATYLETLEAFTNNLRIMHSAAGLTDATGAAERPITMVMSGPAGGVLGALKVAAEAGQDRIISFDMGGTSTDVALCDGAARFRNGATVDGITIQTPMVDIVTVGAGGGSIASLDEGGSMLVGPESAGADPGPACYGTGELPTVSDANLVLGRLRPERALAGGLELDAGRAREALQRLGPAEEMAAAVVEVANANMARAIRAVSVERGHDPADFALVAFGGAGPLHACDLAADVGIRRVIIPRHPGVLSALGMITAPEAAERSHGLVTRLEPTAADSIATAGAGLKREAYASLEASGHQVATLQWVADTRYDGQSHELRVDVPSLDPEAIAAAFHAAHDREYGYATPERAVVLVTLRCRVEAGHPSFDVVATQMDGDSTNIHTGLVDRDRLAPGHRVSGPAIVTQQDATTFVAEGWNGEVDQQLNLILEPAE